MIEQVRNILSWNGKAVRVPNALESKPDTLYIRAVWQRVGGVVGGGKQEDVARLLGISLSTLKRYMTNEGSCPYMVQFGLESLAGMSETGEYYKISGNGALCQALMPFAASMSSSASSRIVLTLSEKNALADLTSSMNLPIDIQGPIDTGIHSKICPLCHEHARFELVDGGRKKMFECINCKRFIISESAEKRVKLDLGYQSWFSTRSSELSEKEFLDIAVTRGENNEYAVKDKVFSRQDFPSIFGRITP